MNKYYCYCGGCIMSRKFPRIYIPCVSTRPKSKYSPECDIDTVKVGSGSDMPMPSIPHTHKVNVVGNKNKLFDVLKTLDSMKHIECDTRTKEAFNKNLDKAISYIMKAASS